MLVDELKQLFTEEEFNQFLLFMKEKGRFWLGKDNEYAQIMYVQDFLNSAYKGLDFRLAEIIETCVINYPQVLGYVKENI